MRKLLEENRGNHDLKRDNHELDEELRRGRRDRGLTANARPDPMMAREAINKP